jgi:hypothetical protein
MTPQWQSWSNVIDYIKMNLGANVNRIELSDEQIQEILENHTLPEFSNYDSLRIYHRMTRHDIVSDYPIRRYQINTDYRILDVNKKINNSMMDDLIGAVELGTTDLADFLVKRNATDMRLSVSPTETYRFVAPDILELIETGFYNSTIEFVLELGVVHKDVSTISPSLYDQFRSLALGDIMINLGRIRKRFGQLSTPYGTIDNNADALIQEGKELKNQVLDTFRMLPPDEYLYFI